MVADSHHKFDVYLFNIINNQFKINNKMKEKEIQETFTAEEITAMMSDYFKCRESKDELKKQLIDFFSDEENEGYLKVDKCFMDMLTDDDWKEISKEVGENICVLFDLVYLESALIPAEYTPRVFQAPRQRRR